MKSIKIKITNVKTNQTQLIEGKNNVINEFEITAPTLNTYIKSGKVYKDEFIFSIATDEDIKCLQPVAVTDNDNVDEIDIEKWNTDVFNSYKSIVAKFEEVILADERWSTLCYNYKTRRNEICGEAILKSDINFLHLTMKQSLPEDKISMSLIRSFIDDYAKQHPINKDSVDDWFSQLILNDEGKIVKNIENVQRYLTYHPKYKDEQGGSIFSHDLFSHTNLIDGQYICDTTMNEIYKHCELDLHISNTQTINSAVDLICHEHSFHPIKTKLEALQWDGEHRLDNFFIRWLCVADTELNRSMTRKWFYGLIKRLYEPGCNFDYMLIIYDKQQGTGKSKIIERIPQCLGINNAVCTTLTCDTSDKDNVIKMNQSWIISLEELTEFLKSSPEKAKQLITQTQDVVRLPYARNSDTFQRHCVFIGTTNTRMILKDYTTNLERRYWIMEARGIKWDDRTDKELLTDEYIQQVLAEAFYLYCTDKNFIYNGLSSNERDELCEVQKRFKTSNADDVLKETFAYLLNELYYETDTVTDYRTFKRMLENTKTQEYIRNNDNTLLDFIDESCLGDDNYTRLKSVDYSVLKAYCEIEMKRKMLPAQYIADILPYDWVLTTRKVKEGRKNVEKDCYIRVENKG